MTSRVARFGGGSCCWCQMCLCVKWRLFTVLNEISCAAGKWEVVQFGCSVVIGRRSWRCRCRYRRCWRMAIRRRCSTPKCFPSKSPSTTTTSTRGSSDTGPSRSSTRPCMWRWYLPVAATWRIGRATSWGFRWRHGAGCWPYSASLAPWGQFPSWFTCSDGMVSRSLYAGNCRRFIIFYWQLH